MNSGRTLLAGSDSRFVWTSVAQIHGLPGIPDWATWFSDELKSHRALDPLLGIGCSPVLVKGEKAQFLDWLSWGVESEAIRFPATTGSILWTPLSLKELFLPAG
jgi:hypothetical protein